MLHDVKQCNALHATMRRIVLSLLLRAVAVLLVIVKELTCFPAHNKHKHTRAGSKLQTKTEAASTDVIQSI